jgi:hypothetical protein
VIAREAQTAIRILHHRYAAIGGHPYACGWVLPRWA